MGYIETAIVKSIVKGPIKVTRNGLKGDHHNSGAFAHISVMGLRQMREYMTELAKYGYTRKTDSVEEEAARIGANILVDDLEKMNDPPVRYGDRFKVGSGGVILIANQRRVPCYKLNEVLDNDKAANRMGVLGCGGFKLEVEHTGIIQAGDMIERIELAPETKELMIPRPRQRKK